MKHAECEQLVERYISGAMSASEEQDFFIKVAVDDELRQTLKAYRIVESALQKDCSEAPSHSDTSRRKVMAVLAATAPIQQPGGLVTSEAASHATHAAGVAKGAVSVILAQKTVMITLVATALAVGAFVLAPMLDRRDASPTSIHDTLTVVAPGSSPSTRVESPIAEPAQIGPAVVSSPTLTTRDANARTSAVPSAASDAPVRQANAPASDVAPTMRNLETPAHTATADDPVVETPVKDQTASEHFAPAESAPKRSVVDTISFKVDFQLRKPRK